MGSLRGFVEVVVSNGFGVVLAMFDCRPILVLLWVECSNSLVVDVDISDLVGTDVTEDVKEDCCKKDASFLDVALTDDKRDDSRAFRRILAAEGTIDTSNLGRRWWLGDPPNPGDNVVKPVGS
jgi:hypothetical protein